jgi:hypothetical protein
MQISVTIERMVSVILFTPVPFMFLMFDPVSDHKLVYSGTHVRGSCARRFPA